GELVAGVVGEVHPLLGDDVAAGRAGLLDLRQAAEGVVLVGVREVGDAVNGGAQSGALPRGVVPLGADHVGGAERADHLGGRATPEGVVGVAVLRVVVLLGGEPALRVVGVGDRVDHGGAVEPALGGRALEGVVVEHAHAAVAVGDADGVAGRVVL